MAIRSEPIAIPVDRQHLPGTLVTQAGTLPGMLFLQGWNSGQEQLVRRPPPLGPLQ